MPGRFTNKSGATIAGHADKWSHANRNPNSHDAGNGSRGKRNQGTGLQGKLNTLPSDSVDTSKMKPEEKLKYFQSLGIMPGKKPEPEQPPAEVPKEEPKNKVQELTSNLGKIFKDSPELLQDIVKKLQSTPKDKFKEKVLDVLRVMQDNTSTNPQEIHGAIMSVLNDQPKVEPKAQTEVSDADWSKHYLMDKPQREWYNSDADYKAGIAQAKAIGKNRKAFNIAMTAAEDASRDWESGYNPKDYKTKNDMVNDYIEAYWDDIEAAINSEK